MRTGWITTVGVLDLSILESLNALDEGFGGQNMIEYSNI